jgi:hypothetical protein
MASNAALFVQWTRSGNQLTGDLQQARIDSGSDSSGTESVANQSVSFTGTVNGSSVTLALSQGLGATQNLTGTLAGSTLDLNYPAQDGGITTIQMASGTAADFNRDLANLQGQVQTANTQAQQAQAAQQQANSVAGDASTVQNDLGSLQSEVSGSSGTSSLGSDMAQMRSDVNQTLTDEQKVLGEVGHTDTGTLCGDAAGVSGDASGVQGDYSGIQGDQSSVGGDASGVSAAIGQLKHDNAALDAGRSQDPADVPTNAPTDVQVAQAINAAEAKIGNENGSTGGALGQAKALVNTAESYANKAQAACNSAGG